MREQGQEGNFQGLLNILIGRRISTADGTEVSRAVLRDVAALLKRVRWDREAVRQLGLDPEGLSPRDRQRFWYQAITQASVDECIAFARAAGYAKMTLWTHSCLAAARETIRKAGFAKIAEERHAEWGVEVVGETWERAL